MTCKKITALVLFLTSFIFRLSAQVNTDAATLQAGAARSALRESTLTARLLRLAKINNWPLRIKMRNGNNAVLYGIDPKGLPKYVAVQDNRISAATIGTDKLWPGGSTGLNLSGSADTLKSRIALWDGGKVLGTHQELNGRVLQKDNVTELSDHSTHVSGTLIASGVNPSARGMSFGAKQLLAYDYNNHISEMYAASPGLLISNHSYGTIAGWNFNTDKNRWEFNGDPGDTVDFKFGYYDDDTQAWDSIAYHAPYYLIVKSAGNNRDVTGPEVGAPYYRPNNAGTMIPAGNRPANLSSNNGYDIIPTYGVAKNILCVGAVNPIPGGYTRPADVVLAPFSSWGPTDDGRIKPDVVTDGVNVLSSISTSNNAYAIYSGTSMSSPAAAGSGFLLQEYYQRKYHTFMRAATLKGLIIHTADEAGPADGPDYQNGYGLVDMPKAAAVITSNNTDQRIREGSLTNGATYTQVDTASGKGPLVVTLSWTDPAAPVDEVNILNNRTRKLVNDLDVSVFSNGKTYYPWILDRRNPGNAATTGIDTLNNVEKIVINDPVPGKTYTVIVNHKGILKNGAQAYSLIISGVGGNGYCTSAPASPAGTRINEVDLSNLANVNAAGCTSYTDFTDKTINLQSSQTLPFTVNLGSCDATSNQRVVKIFIDYNNNGVFNDPGETAAVSTVLPGGTASFTGNITVPAGKLPGTSTVMRIVAVETTDPTGVNPCGVYSNGETQDYRVEFTSLTRDISPDAVVDPLSGVCASDSQRITVRLKNLGTVDQSNVPVTLKITSGATTLVNTTTTCPLNIPAQGNVLFTFQPAFHPEAGKTYVVTVTSALNGDQDNSNNSGADSLLISAGSGTTITGTAAICPGSPSLAGLKANTTDSSNAVLWFDSPTSTTPIAGGLQATTNVVPANQTYYMGVNEGIASVGPKNKTVFANGGYNTFDGNFIEFHNDVPVTLNTTRLYVSHGGRVTFTVADLASWDSCSGAYSYYALSSTTINTYATTPNIKAGPVTGNSPLDTGAVFLLNLAVPTTGNHILIVVCDETDSTSIFRNNGITNKPYPFGVKGVFTITGNSAVNPSDCSDRTYDQAYYYFLYDLKVSLANCPSPRIAVKATTTDAPVISRVANFLSSNFPTGNHWYYNDTAIAGATADTVSLQGPGTYKTVVLDSLGCTLESNAYVYVPGSDIGLSAYPSPSDGNFTMQFFLTSAANVDVKIFNLLGSEVYSDNYGTVSGSVNKPIHLRGLSAGMYVLKLQVGGKKYTRKIMVR